MQTNPYPIVAIDIETDLPTELITCTCSHGNAKKVGACICTDCKCHLRKRQTPDYILIPIPSPRMQCFGYGIIVSTITVIAVYMLLQPK